MYFSGQFIVEDKSKIIYYQKEQELCTDMILRVKRGSHNIKKVVYTMLIDSDFPSVMLYDMNTRSY